MATSQTGKKEEQGDLSDIKRKLAWRMGAAGLMIIGLLGGLAIFDHLSAPSVTEPAEPQFTEPVPVPKKVVTQPVTPTEPAVDTPQDKDKPSVPESSATPVDKTVPPVEPPPRPEVSAKPTVPRSSQPAARAPSASASPVPASPTKSEEPKPNAVSAPSARAAAPLAPEAPPKPLLSRIFSGFALQAGVFSDPRRAEELHAKLTLEGIPSTIEARVEVGPFKTRAEAEAAREKMKALGVDSVLLLPKAAKP